MDEQEAYLFFIRKQIETIPFMEQDQYLTKNQKQMNAIYTVIEKLSIMPDAEIQKNVETFIKEQQRITDEINKHREAVGKLMNEEYENYQNIYKNFLEKL
jgi:hypothetical protein